MNYVKDEVVIKGDIKVTNHLPGIGINSVQDEILKGLKTIPKYISSKFFYDDKGSELFEEITKLDEYYPTRTEKEILSNITSHLNIDFSNYSIIELGSGDPSKIRLLLNQIPEDKLSTLKYYPVDISQSAIENSIEQLMNEFPMLEIEGIVADFIHQMNMIPKTSKRLFCFFGSTIGNLNNYEIEVFLSMLSKEMKIGDSLLLGMDMVKNISVLESAYNDSKNITSYFNKNILNVVNNLTSSDFNSSDFEHVAFYNLEKNRIEMHLKANKNLDISFNSINDNIHIEKGETIHTENSHKFDKKSIESMALWSNLDIEKIIKDKNQWFSLVHFIKNN